MLISIIKNSGVLVHISLRKLHTCHRLINPFVSLTGAKMLLWVFDHIDQLLLKHERVETEAGFIIRSVLTSLWVLG